MLNNNSVALYVHLTEIRDFDLNQVRNEPLNYDFV